MTLLLCSLKVVVVAAAAVAVVLAAAAAAFDVAVVTCGGGSASGGGSAPLRVLLFRNVLNIEIAPLTFEFERFAGVANSRSASLFCCHLKPNRVRSMEFPFDRDFGM